MKLHLQMIAAAALVLVVTACASQYTETEAPKNLTLDEAGARIDVRFAPGSAHLLAGGPARWAPLGTGGRGGPSTAPVRVSAGGPPALAAARFETIAALLLPYRIVASSRPLGGVPV